MSSMRDIQRRAIRQTRSKVLTIPGNAAKKEKRDAMPFFATWWWRRFVALCTRLFPVCPVERDTQKSFFCFINLPKLPPSSPPPFETTGPRRTRRCLTVFRPDFNRPTKNERKKGKKTKRCTKRGEVVFNGVFYFCFFVLFFRACHVLGAFRMVFLWLCNRYLCVFEYACLL